MAAEIVAFGQRCRHSRGDGFNAGREDLLLFLSETAKMPFSFAASHGFFELHPSRIADPIEKADRRPQIGARAAGEVGRRDGAVAVPITFALQETEADHRISADPQGAPRNS